MIWRFFYLHRAMILAIAILSTLSAAMAMMLLARINDLADNAFRVEALRQLSIGAGWLMAFLITSGVTQFFLAKLGGLLVAQLRTELSQRYIDVEYESVAHRKSLVFGALIEDIERIAPLVLLAPLLAYNFLLALAFSAYLVSVSAALFGILLASLALTLGVTLLLGYTTRSRFDDMRRAEEVIFDRFRAISDGKKEMSLNLARAEHFVGHLLVPAIQRAQELMVGVHLRLGFANVWSKAMLYGVLLTLAYASHAMLALSTNVVIKFVIGAIFLVDSINFLVQVSLQVGVGMASVRHLERMGLDLPSHAKPHLAASHSATKVPDGWQRIIAEDICYWYPTEDGKEESNQGVGPISLQIDRGDIVFIEGINGSGKSTLLLLICGLLRPSAGQLLIDGRPAQEEIELYRRRFAGVFGDFCLFSHVLDAFGQCLTDRQVEELLQRLGLQGQVRVRQGQLSRLALSTGQRKRLALLQCYAEDRDICFFDEWAADQDAAFREYFYHVLLPELKHQGKTVIVVSHDDRYFDVADHIIKLDAGLIVSCKSTARVRIPKHDDRETVTVQSDA